MWANVSTRLAQTATGDVIVIAPRATSDSFFFRNELRDRWLSFHLLRVIPGLVALVLYVAAAIP